MIDTPAEVLAAAATVTGHTVGCMCQRCDDVRGERTHPEGDYRPTVARLIAEVERLNRVRDSLARRLGVRWGELEEARAALAQMTDERDGWRAEAESLCAEIERLRGEVDPPNDIEATGHCCCAGCIGMGPCDLDPLPTDDDEDDLPSDED